ncbi:helix-turn-helix domain-containing protein [Kushneria konosiri]|uniref:helix-turn-helix domain-containing protein n=1 Tax=Kushneria konosiri TaxID=698828 RepID=UPI0011E4D4F1|nr:hypothetical protein [Kushneria konosiri]
MKKKCDFLPEDIKRIRNKTGMTQESFSNAFSIELDVLCGWERGDCVPSEAATVLLDLIDRSPSRIYSILDPSKEENIRSSNGKSFLKNVIFDGCYTSLQKLVESDFRYKIEVIDDLILINGFSYTKIDKKENDLEFYAGHSSKSLDKVVSYNCKDKQLVGDLKDVLEKTYLVLFAIEHELSAAMGFPHEMRMEEIKRVKERINVSNEFYSKILKSW